VAAEGRLLVERLPQLVLGGEGKVAQVGKADERISNSRLTELARVKGRCLADATVLALPRADRKPPRFLPGRRLDLALPDPVAFAVIAAKPIRRHRHVEAQINLAAVQRLLPTTVVGSYPQPDWLVDRQMLGTRLPPRVR